MKRILTTALIAGAAAFIPTQSQAGDRPTRVENDGRGAIAVTIEDGKLSSLFVRYDERDNGRDSDRDRRDDRYDRDDHRDSDWRGDRNDRRDDRYDRRERYDGCDVISYRGEAYIYQRGQFLQRTRRGWVPVAAPLGIVVSDLPPRAEYRWIRGDLYQVAGSTYFQRTRGGYQVVAEPFRHRGGHDYYSPRDHR